jgi:hypothetical protein
MIPPYFAGWDCAGYRLKKRYASTPQGDGKKNITDNDQPANGVFRTIWFRPIYIYQNFGVG